MRVFCIRDTSKLSLIYLQIVHIIWTDNNLVSLSYIITHGDFQISARKESWFLVFVPFYEFLGDDAKQKFFFLDRGERDRDRD